MSRRGAAVEVLPPESEVKALVELKPDALVTRAREVAEIVLRDDAERAGLVLRIVRTQIRAIEAKYKRLRDKINEAIRDNRDEEKKELQRWQQCDAIISAPLEAWLKADREATEAANRRALQEAEEKAKAERQAEAEAIRKAAENAPTKREQKALESQARQVARAPLMPVAAPVVEATKIAGISTPTGKIAEVVNLKIFLKAVLDGTIPEAAITINQPWLNEQATQRGKDLNFPGVVVRDKTTLSARGL